jgi:hypothetical protein
LGAMRKDLIGARDFSKLDEIYDKVGFLRSLLKYGYFVKAVYDDEEITAILNNTEYKTEMSTTLDQMDDEKMLRLTHLECILSSDSTDPSQRHFKVKHIKKNAENTYTATFFNEIIRGVTSSHRNQTHLQITFQRDENGFSIRSVDGLKKVNTLYFTNRSTFNHVYPQISDMSKIKTIPEGASWKKSAEFYVVKINSAVDIVYKYALQKFR